MIMRLWCLCSTCLLTFVAGYALRPVIEPCIDSHRAASAETASAEGLLEKVFSSALASEACSTECNTPQVCQAACDSKWLGDAPCPHISAPWPTVPATSYPNAGSSTAEQPGTELRGPLAGGWPQQNQQAYYVIVQGCGSSDRIRRIAFTGGTTILDALSQIDGGAQLLNKMAIVLRCNGSKTDQVFPIDCDEVLRGANGGCNFLLAPGDRLLVLGGELLSPSAQGNSITDGAPLAEASWEAFTCLTDVVLSILK